MAHRSGIHAALFGGLWVALALAYLAATFSGHRELVLLVVGLMAGAFVAASMHVLTGILLGALLGILALHFSASLGFLAYAPPIAAFLFMALFFLSTVRPGVEPLIVRIARTEHPDVPPELEAHARWLTWFWGWCFVAMAAIALALAPQLPIDAWSHWVHAMGYAVPALLFLGEHLYRLRRFNQYSHGPILPLVRNIVKVVRAAAIEPPAPRGEAGP